MLNAVYSFILSKHSTKSDVTKAKLMPIEERLKYALCEVPNKSLKNPWYPKYCKLEPKVKPVLQYNSEQTGTYI